MNDNTKLIISIILGIFFVFILVITLNLLVVSFWLSGYTPYYSEQRIAQVTVSDKQSNENGIYRKLTYTPIAYKNSLNTILGGPSSQATFSDPLEINVKEGQITFATRFVEAHDSVFIFNFEKIYQTYLVGETYVANENDYIWQDILDSPNIFNSPFFSTSSVSTPALIPSERGGLYEMWITNEGIEWREVN